MVFRLFPCQYLSVKNNFHQIRNALNVRAGWTIPLDKHERGCTLEWSVRLSRWEFIGNFHTRDTPKKSGFNWDPMFKVWWTKSPTQAAKLLRFAGPVTRQELLQALKDCL